MVVERVYNVPLRKGFRDVARYKKSKKAVATLIEFLSRHMRQPDHDKILIGKNLNKELWKHGIKNPPCQVKVTVIKEDNGDVKAELYGFKYEHKKKAEKESEKEKKAPKIEEKAKEAKKKSTSEEKHEHVHEDTHEHNHEHSHEEKHEHAAGQAHEHPQPVAKKPAIKKIAKKAE